MIKKIKLAIVFPIFALAFMLTSCHPVTPEGIGKAQFSDIPGGSKKALCIMRRETRGRPDLVANPNAISATHDYGLFQINRAAHKANFERMFHVNFERGALDPTLNAKYARYLYNYYRSRGMNGWTPWNGGKYPC